MTEITDSTWAGTQFTSTHAAAVAALLDILTASNTTHAEDALDIAQADGCAAIVAEAAHELGLCSSQMDALVWAWDDAIEKLQSLI